MKLDNSTLPYKVSLRRAMLRDVEAPVVLETHGGAGKVFHACYADLAPGVVIEADEAKACVLASQRPTWAVYQANCEVALAAGLAAERPINCLDVDPYGDPWPTIAAFLGSERTRPRVLHIVVNDGMRHGLRIRKGWVCESLRLAVSRFGSDDLFNRHEEAARFLMEAHAAKAGYSVDRWHSYTCGKGGAMTHYLARLKLGST